MEDKGNSGLSQYVRIGKEDGSDYIFKFPDDNQMGELKNMGDGNMIFTISGSGVSHYSTNTTIDLLKAGCNITVGAASPITLTLPGATGAVGYQFTIIRTQDVSSTVTIQSQNSETISIVDNVNGSVNGTNIHSNNSQPIGSSVCLFSTGTEWVGTGLSNGWSVIA